MRIRVSGLLVIFHRKEMDELDGGSEVRIRWSDRRSECDSVVVNLIRVVSWEVEDRNTCL